MWLNITMFPLSSPVHTMIITIVRWKTTVPPFIVVNLHIKLFMPFSFKNFFSHAKKSGFLPLATAARDNLYICGFIKVNTRTIIKNVNKVHKGSFTLQAETRRAEPNLTGPSWTKPSEWLFTLQAEPTRIESSAADISELRECLTKCIHCVFQ